jgi:glycosyltransferase involved in cell wall biosynthesis
MTVLFLYTELAEYFLKCCEVLSNSCQVHVIRWPVNKEAPFQFEYDHKIKIYEKDQYSFAELERLIAEINPGVIICSGWIDREYLRLIKPYFRKIPTVFTCDTRWNGSAKQYLAQILSRLVLRRIFSNAWVPGDAQRNYVKKLGYKDENIRNGFYCCDLPKFNQFYFESAKLKKDAFPKRFLYIGRYYDFKGIEDLWVAFIQMQMQQPSEWELWCIGTGTVKPVNHPKIKHFGFVQPKDLYPFLEQTGVAVIPSRFEPWAVVMQEYAAAGLPIISSNAVGANEAFLDDGQNGFSFLAGDMVSLQSKLRKITDLSTEELLLMAEKSHNIAQKISQQTWTNTIFNFYDRSRKK